MKKVEKIKEDIDLFKLSKIQLIKKINSLELEIDVLQDTIKDELFTIFMKKLEEPQEINRLKRDNTNLRKKNKVLRQLLKTEK